MSRALLVEGGWPGAWCTRSSCGNPTEARGCAPCANFFLADQGGRFSNATRTGTCAIAALQYVLVLIQWISYTHFDEGVTLVDHQ